mmetsp:Transcript_44507/g.112141  ORF Transcript_44507/g.112141 Transcript_44507/m.112141 type:complete len:347 (+) Transcript_44507:1828-2868(+)
MRIIEHGHFVSWEELRHLVKRAQILNDLVKLLDTIGKSLVEEIFLITDHTHNALLLTGQLWEDRSESFDDDRDQLAEEAWLGAEVLGGKVHCTTEDTAQHVAFAGLVGVLAVGDGHGERTHVIGHHTVGDTTRVGEVGGVGGATHQLVDAGKDRLEGVRVVVRALVDEDRGEALQAHAGVDVAVGQLAQRAVRLAVELHEDQVPDLDHALVVHVHQRGGVAAADAVVVNLRGGAAGTGGAHLPEVVLGVACDQTRGGDPQVKPDLSRLVVTRDAQLLAALKVGHVHASRVHLVHLGEQLPGHGARLLLEVIAETPRAQHLEHGVMVGVSTHILQIVVLATGANAPL